MRTVTSLFALTFAACTTPADQYRAILPDDRLMIDEAAFSDALARGAGEPSEYYVLTRDTVTNTNLVTGEVLGLVDAITQFDATWTDDETLALWGPWLDDATATYGQLWIKQEADQSWSWAIEIRPEDSAEDAWQGVLAGHVDAGATEESSGGWWVMDLTALEDADAGDGTTGEVGCAYLITPELVSADVAFGDIAEDGSLPADGAYHYEQIPGEEGLMDLALNADISDPPNGSAELLIIRSRWQNDGQGRSDAYVTGGDLGPLTYTESDCWDAGHTSVFYESNFELRSEGDEAACAFAEPSFNEEG